MVCSVGVEDLDEATVAANSDRDIQVGLPPSDPLREPLAEQKLVAAASAARLTRDPFVEWFLSGRDCLPDDFALAI
jgi:hypothetical protein